MRAAPFLAKSGPGSHGTEYVPPPPSLDCCAKGGFENLSRNGGSRTPTRKDMDACVQLSAARVYSPRQDLAPELDASQKWMAERIEEMEKATAAALDAAREARSARASRSSEDFQSLAPSVHQEGLETGLRQPLVLTRENLMKT